MPGGRQDCGHFARHFRQASRGKAGSEKLRELEHERAGIIPAKATRVAAQRKLADHLEDFLGDLRRRGKSDKYLANIEFRVGRLIADCGWNQAKDVTADSFQAWLREQRELKDKTANDYLEAARCFFNWLVKLGRARSNPLLSVEKVKTKEGKAEDGRALSDDEMLRLAAVAGERKAVYLMAVYTGLRDRNWRRSSGGICIWMQSHRLSKCGLQPPRTASRRTCGLLPELAAALRNSKGGVKTANRFLNVFLGLRDFGGT